MPVGGTIETPFTMTRAYGNDRIALSIEEDAAVGDSRCAIASGTAVFPSYIAYQGDVGYDRGDVPMMSVEAAQDAAEAHPAAVAWKLAQPDSNLVQARWLPADSDEIAVSAAALEANGGSLPTLLRPGCSSEGLYPIGEPGSD